MPDNSQKSRLRKMLLLSSDFFHSHKKKDWLINQYQWRLFRHRLRRQDRLNRAFDDKFGTDTATEIMLVDTGVAASDTARGNTVYRPFWESNFRAAMKLLSIKFDDYTFVDIGSGKGRLMMLASEHDFKCIVGIEYSPGLHAISVANLAKYRSSVQNCALFEPILGDALTYELHPGPVICLIFNALDQETMRKVLSNFDLAAGEREDPVFILYANLRNVSEIGINLYNTVHLKRLFASNREVILGNAAAAKEFVSK